MNQRAQELHLGLKSELPVGREPGYADADESQRARSVAKTAIEETARDISDDFRLVHSRWQRCRPRPDGEVAVPELRGYRAAGKSGVTKPLGDELGKTAYFGVEQSALGDVAREGVLR